MRWYGKYVNRWRRFMFQRWMYTSHGERSTTEIAAAVDQLIFTALLLDYAKRQKAMQIPNITEICEDLASPTTRELFTSLRGCLPCPILRSVLNPPPSAGDFVIPRTVFESRWEIRLANATWMLLGDKPLPLSLFGDLHQLYVANPLRPPSKHAAAGNMRYERGIHYTPASIVDYLVTTVLKETSWSRPEEENQLPRILDPSCGCGAFLIASLRCLLNRRQSQTARNSRALPLAAQEKLDLVENTIFGLDIDEQAVAWTKRLLLLAVWETLEREESVAGNLRLPQLARNIVCRSFLDPLCCDADDPLCCPIDVILGGPPFVRLAELRRSQPRRIQTFRRQFRSARFGQFDLYMLFIERSLEILRDGGHLGFSVSNTFLRSASGSVIRKIMEKESRIREIVEFDDQQLYPDAATQIALVSLTKGETTSAVRHVWIKGSGQVRGKLGSLVFSNAEPHPSVEIRQLPADRFDSSRWSLASREEQEWLSAIRAVGIPLGGLPVVLGQGISTGADAVFIMREVGRTFPRVVFAKSRVDDKTYRVEGDVTRPIIRGRYVRGFCPPRSPNVCIFPYDNQGRLISEETFQADFPLAFGYLLPHKSALTQRRRGRGTPWYAPMATKPLRLNRTPKLVCGKIDGGAGFTIVEDHVSICHESVVYLAPDSTAPDPYFLLGVLNSDLFWRYAKLTTPTIGRGRHALRLSALRRFPLVLPSSGKPQYTAQRIAELAGRLVRSHAFTQEKQRLKTVLDREVRILYGIHER